MTKGRVCILGVSEDKCGQGKVWSLMHPCFPDTEAEVRGLKEEEPPPKAEGAFFLTHSVTVVSQCSFRV
jgi:hypothetical protein